ncbi:helix-turn-helix domain-containing protein [Actinoplanes sp. CA-131856]
MPTSSRRPTTPPRRADTRLVTSDGLQTFTPTEAAELLRIGESWLRRKAAARVIPCTFVGKHLRFTAVDIAAIIAAGATPATGRKPRRKRPTAARTDDLPAPPNPSVHAHRDDHDPDGSSTWHG